MLETEEKDTSLFAQKEKGILLLEDRKFAVGLTWLTMDQDINSGLLKQRTEKLESDYYCVRSTIANQHGFGFISLGHRPNMIAAAAVAADMLVGDWHGVFSADNGWWYLAVHADNIAPGGDRFFFSEEQAYNHFTEQSSLYNWPRSYAPATWNIEGANPEIPLHKLLQDVTQAPVLRASSVDAIFGGKKRRNFVFFVSILVLASLFSAAILPGLIAKEKKKKELAMRPDIMAPAVITPPPKVEVAKNAGFGSNLRLPKPSVVLHFCNIGFSLVIKPLPGWSMEKVNCSILNDGKRAQTQVQWRKKIGSLEMVKQYFKRFDQSVQLDYNGSDIINAIYQSKELNNITLPITEIFPREGQIRVLYERFGNLGKLEISDVTPSPTDPNLAANINRFAREGELQQKPPYLKMVLYTRTPPKVLAPYFDVPGLKLQNVSWSLRTMDWIYTADILFDSDLFKKYYKVGQNVQ